MAGEDLGDGAEGVLGHGGEDGWRGYVPESSVLCRCFLEECPAAGYISYVGFLASLLISEKRLQRLVSLPHALVSFFLCLLLLLLFRRER